MSEFLGISAALDGHLSTMVGLPPVAWENVAYTPVDGTLYIRPTLLAGNTSGATLSPTGTDQHVGIYQIDVFGDVDVGKNEAVVMADLIADHFKPVTEMTSGSILVRAITVSRRQGIREGSRWKIPVEVQYLSYTIKR
jgi:hypothetical protein